MGVILFIIFLIFFLITLFLIMAVGAIAGAIFMYFRATISYIASVKEEVTNPFAKVFTICSVVGIAILPVVAIILGIVFTAILGGN